MRVILLSLALAIASLSKVFASPEWSRAELLFAQEQLNSLGYNAGSLDGIWGKKTQSALADFFRDNKLSTSKFATFKNKLEALENERFAHLNVIMDKRAAIRFETRIGIGAPEHRVKKYVGKTRKEAIGIVVNELSSYMDAYSQPLWVSELDPLGVKDEILPVVLPRNECNVEWYQDSLEKTWIKAALESEVPQFDRLALFWLDHFSVQFSQYVEPHAYARHMNFARTWKGESFTSILRRSLFDPGNIVFLNNDRNHKNKQNENLAREFLELYSLGEGNYSEQDIRELAKLITGLSYNKNTEEFWYSPKLKYTRPVKIFGKNISTLDEFMSLLVRQEAYGDLIIKKFANEYISHDNPSAEFIRSIKKDLKRSDFDLEKIFELIISSKEFWVDENKLNLVKSPFDLTVGTARTLNSSGSIPYDFRFIKRVTRAMSKMGQDLTEPPNVEGWKSGLEWIEGSQLTLRADLLYKIYSKDALNPKGITKSNASRAWRNYQTALNYEQNLKAFYEARATDELYIETIDFDFQRNGFKPNGPAWMRFVLVGAQMDGLPPMDIRFVLDIAEDPSFGNGIEFIEQETHPKLFNPKHFKGDGAQQLMRPKLPLNRSESYKRLSVIEKKRLNLILEATKLVLDEHNREHFLELTNPRQLGALQWLLRFHKFRSIDDFNRAENTKIKMFATLDPQDWKKRIFLKYEKKLCRIHKYVNLEVLDGFLSAFSENDSRRFRVFSDKARQVNSPFSFSELLLPDIEVQIDDIEFTKILVSEAYNLK